MFFPFAGFLFVTAKSSYSEGGACEDWDCASVFMVLAGSQSSPEEGTRDITRTRLCRKPQWRNFLGSIANRHDKAMMETSPFKYSMAISSLNKFSSRSFLFVLLAVLAAVLVAAELPAAGGMRVGVLVVPLLLVVFSAAEGGKINEEPDSSRSILACCKRDDDEGAWTPTATMYSCSCTKTSRERSQTVIA